MFCHVSYMVNEAFYLKFEREGVLLTKLPHVRGITTFDSRVKTQKVLVGRNTKVNQEKFSLSAVNAKSYDQIIKINYIQNKVAQENSCETC